jgi:hypothetical protein
VLVEAAFLSLITIGRQFSGANTATLLRTVHLPKLVNNILMNLLVFHHGPKHLLQTCQFGKGSIVGKPLRRLASDAI